MYRLLVLAILTLSSCSRIDFSDTRPAPGAASKATQLTEHLVGHIGDSTRVPDLHTPDLEMDWENYPSGYGVNHQSASIFTFGYGPISITTSRSYGWPAGSVMNLLKYGCPIANLAPQDTTGAGRTDFAMSPSADGYPTGSGYNIPGMLEVTLFSEADSLQKGAAQKQRFDVTYSDFKLGYNWAYFHQYNGDTAWIPAQAADFYINVVPFPHVNGISVDGRYVLLINVNPERLIRESNYANNITALRMEVVGGIPRINLAANVTPKAPSNFTGQYLQGKGGKRVELDWDCPYHEPWVRHSFRIKKDGQVLAEHFDESLYSDPDPFPAGKRSATYSVEILIPGLGYSPAKTLTVYKRG